jgi:predicted MFS family arabinose efflux permease
MVMAVGTLGSLLAWNYWELLVCRLLAGVGAAMIPPNSVAAIADRFAPAERGRPISVLISASFVALVIATPVVAVLGEMGGWRLPFIVVGVSIIGVWALQWYWLPEHPSVGRRFGFIALQPFQCRNHDLAGSLPPLFSAQSGVEREQRIKHFDQRYRRFVAAL